MKKTVLIITTFLSVTTISAQVTETFESQTDNALSFASDTKTFNLGGVFHIEHLQDYGLGPSNYYIDNSNSCGTPGVTGIISTSDGNNVRLNSLWMFVSADCIYAGSGNILVSWYRNNNLVSFMSYSITSVITVNNGYVKLDFDADGQAAIEADEWRFQVPASLNYMAIDDFKWTDPALQTSFSSFESSVIYYPNPVAETLNIDVAQEYESVTAKVMNTLGQVLYEEKILSTKNIKLKINGQTGLYLIELKNNLGEKTVLKVFKS
ncbi:MULTISPECIES: T9SS type A sorting domain-containing protein [unclassified Flavobacterium]|uniref:T9SS type A sorting domain-containing protein n=1 Tax=unclassified Flavobacterium TaxID=196869 RepID=UPI000EAE113A|nr:MULTISPECIES: T9SS type A sorting domain-containing protein [unclassified Flavobacterium]RKS01657.1 putative secreted protein (Por secretion system target) [Flavobacterium sp. 102]